jgi:hypothetical protein
VVVTRCLVGQSLLICLGNDDITVGPASYRASVVLRLNMLVLIPVLRSAAAAGAEDHADYECMRLSLAIPDRMPRRHLDFDQSTHILQLTRRLFRLQRLLKRRLISRS